MPASALPAKYVGIGIVRSPLTNGCSAAAAPVAVVKSRRTEEKSGLGAMVRERGISVQACVESLGTGVNVLASARAHPSQQAPPPLTHTRTYHRGRPRTAGSRTRWIY